MVAKALLMFVIEYMYETSQIYLCHGKTRDTTDKSGSIAWIMIKYVQY